jgi:putative NADH-flavin reductase
MKTLVLGASGATGKLVVSQLLDKGISPKILVRDSAILPREILDRKDIEVIKGNINDYTIEQITEILNDCSAIVSCLGHNISFKGILGKPHKLVCNAVMKITDVLVASDTKKKFVLMSTTAYTDKVHGEKETFGESIVFGLLKVLLPPHTDNVKSGDYLLKKIKESEYFEWVAVRPDSLIDEANISQYQIMDKKMRSPIFNPGKTSRINVAHFIVDLLSEDKLWQVWKYKAPVIYNKV